MLLIIDKNFFQEDELFFVCQDIYFKMMLNIKKKYK